MKDIQFTVLNMERSEYTKTICVGFQKKLISEPRRGVLKVSETKNEY